MTEQVSPGGKDTPINGSGGNGTKAKVLAVVCDSPSLNIQEIAEELGLARTTVVYHMRQLLREKAVTTKRQGHHLLHFPAPMPPLDQAALTALRVPSLRAVIEAVFFNPKATRSELEEMLFASPRTLRRCLHRLQKEGLAVVHGRARSSEPFVELRPEFRTLLGRHHDLLRRDRDLLDEPKGVKAILALLPQAWRTFVSPW